MASADIASPIRAASGRVMDAAGRLRLPVRSGRFWLVQVGVLFVAFLDEIVLDLMRFLPPFEIPRSTVTALLLIPVIYAALNFGVHGAVGTALWATALMCPDWLFIGGVAPPHTRGAGADTAIPTTGARAAVTCRRCAALPSCARGGCGVGGRGVGAGGAGAAASRGGTARQRGRRV